MKPRQKNIALLVGFLLLLWLSYHFSFVKTMALKREAKTVKMEQTLLSNASQKLYDLKGQNVFYDSILRSKKISLKSSFQHHLLERITVFADSSKIAIVAFDSPHQIQTDLGKLNTFSFTLQGPFSKITNLIYKLEQEYRLGKIFSVSYKKKKNYRRNTDYLECRVLLQQVEGE